jgi:SET domain-containing protein
MTDFYSYFSPKLEVRTDPKGGYGVFVIAPIARDEVLTMLGGRIITAAQKELLWNGDTTTLMQVEEDLYLLSLQEGDPADRVNHSCDPNVGLRGPMTFVAMRDLKPGEEACFDYAMSDGSDYDTFECACGAPHCRGLVTGTDWQRPELWDRYAGYFSPYLQRRIDALRGRRYSQSSQ